MADNVGNFELDININTKGATKNTKALEKELKNVDKELNSIQKETQAIDKEFDDLGLLCGDAVMVGGGGMNALMRASVAALLNASNTDVSYPYTEAEIIGMVQAAFAAEDYEPTKDVLDWANNLGCPLD